MEGGAGCISCRREDEHMKKLSPVYGFSDLRLPSSVTRYFQKGVVAEGRERDPEVAEVTAMINVAYESPPIKRTPLVEAAMTASYDGLGDVLQRVYETGHGKWD
jgi:hypothetical protein